MEQNEKKNDVKKKKTVQQSWMGYCPFSTLVSRYNVLYRDRQGHRHVGVCSKALGYGRGGPAIRPRQATTRSTTCKGVRQRARSLAGRVCRDTINCIVTREWPGR